ncbi:MAG TPA: hypothetical protein PLP56_06680 [Candidatus Omnitrophota bacterium]|nr:hypothetical protein [Candidatus Omnitrophota bacterium]
METKDRFHMIELILTIGMVVCAVGLFPAPVIPFKGEITLVLTAGFIFSLLRMPRPNGWAHAAAPGAIAAICAWMIYMILSAPLAYRDVVIMMLKGLIFIEVALSFTLCVQSFAAYVQALSVPLFMAQALFVKEHALGQAVFIVIYLLALGLAMHINFFTDAGRRAGTIFTHSISFIVPVGLIAASLLFGGFLASAFPLSKATHAGILFREREGADRQWEQDYYDKQELVQKESSEMILDLASQERRIESFNDLNNLVKNSPLTIEAERGEEGLVSILKTPGAGLENIELEKRRHLNAYGDSKTKFEQNTAMNQLSQRLKADPFSIPARMSIMNHANRIRQAQSLAELKNLPAPQQKVKDYSMGSGIRSEIIEQLQRLQEWKLYEIYRKDMAYLSDKAQTLAGEEKELLAEMAGGLRGAGGLADLEPVQQKFESSRAEGYFAGSGIIDALQEALAIKTHMIQVAQAHRAQAALAENIYLAPEKMKEMHSRIDEAVQINRVNDAAGAQGTIPTPVSFIPYQPEHRVPLRSLSVTPPEVLVGIGDETVIPTVTGICADGSKWDFTDIVIWKSTDRTIADVVAGRIYAHDTGVVSLTAVYELIESPPVPVTVVPPKLVSIIARADRARGDPHDVFTLTAVAVWSDARQEDVTGRVNWELSDRRAFRAEKNMLYPLRPGRSAIRAVYEGLISQPVALEVTASFRWILGILAGIFGGILAAFLLSAAVLLYLTDKKKKELCRKKSDPREYLIALYENIRHILRISGMRSCGNLPYKHFVLEAHNRTNIPHSLLLNMTEAYEEARFSAHTMSDSSIAAATDQYNQALRSLLENGSAAYRIKLVSKSLIYRLPLSV